MFGFLGGYLGYLGINWYEWQFWPFFAVALILLSNNYSSLNN